MNVLNKEFIKNCKKSHIVDLAVEQSQLLVAATKTIKKLEKQVESLSVELGSKNQQVLFTAWGHHDISQLVNDDNHEWKFLWNWNFVLV